MFLSGADDQQRPSLVWWLRRYFLRTTPLHEEATAAYEKALAGATTEAERGLLRRLLE